MTPETVEEITKGGLSIRDLLAPFRAIAAGCSERECREILEECDEPDICLIYERRLKELTDRRIEIEYYEAKFSKGPEQLKGK